MKKRIILFAWGICILQPAAVLFGSLGASVYCAEEEAVDPNQWDFGRIKQGEVVKHDFVLQNKTDKVLKIGRIHTSCGCTASQAGKKSLAASESTTIGVTFNSKGYQGEVKQFVYVHINHPEIEIVRFMVKADVVK